MASFWYTNNQIVRFYVDSAFKWNYASASKIIHEDIKGTAYKGLVHPVLD